MTLIEQATKRLEELRRAGVELPWSNAQGGIERNANVAALRPIDAGNDPTAPASKVAAEEARGHRRSMTVNLDLQRLQASGFLVPAMVRSEIAREFRDIKRPLLKNARLEEGAPARGNVIMVTSALPGEGKTFCAINLAMSIAMEVDSHVLLVDADVLRPTILKTLGVPPAPGLMDLLADSSADISTFLLRTNVPKLTVLPSGGSEGNSTELLASAAMERLLDELSTRYADRIVVVDSPPLLLTTESRVLASRVGQIVMVVEAFRTSQASVAQGFAAVEQCPLVYAVLNKAREKSHANGGYYGYE